jgi:uncharacterized membrane protein YeaQ/YmgE (transglycosylase-associated protein family)
MNWLWTALIGLVAGALAKWIMPGKEPGGIIITMLLGLAGSVLMTFLGRLVGWYGEADSARFIASTLGAILILWIYRMYLSKKSSA